MRPEKVCDIVGLYLAPPPNAMVLWIDDFVVPELKKTAVGSVDHFGMGNQHAVLCEATRNSANNFSFCTN